MKCNKWYFLKFQLILGTTPTSQDVVNVLLESYSEFSVEMNDTYLTSNVVKLNRATMQMSTGMFFSSSQLPSYSLVRQVTLLIKHKIVKITHSITHYFHF